ncbi:hypothetical protein CBR_g6549 [Chara braunii]|uniref:Uncharacterized protein n=1 Tax=Chara braunii TaxID=69332 RepID=A0A388KKD0_CHABU|nr:hypothetical protein CBR_g6549 [Chara braunii]|eukprot:GBG70423.1 hypothetical protein CBR_g6549 [Chara braunii]
MQVRNVSQQEKERERIKEEERNKKAREAEEWKKERQKFHKEIGQLLGEQLKEVCRSIQPTTGASNHKEDEIVRLRRESEEFRRSMEEKIEKLTLENEQLRCTKEATNEGYCALGNRSGVKRRTDVLGEGVVEPNPTTQREHTHLWNRLMPQTNLRTTFDEVTIVCSEDEDDDSAPLVRSSTMSKKRKYENGIRRDLRGQKKVDFLEICAKEGVQFATIKQATEDLVKVRMEKAFPTKQGECSHASEEEDD